MDDETIIKERRIEARRVLLEIRVLLYRLSLVAPSVADNSTITRFYLELDGLERGMKWY